MRQRSLFCVGLILWITGVFAPSPGNCGVSPFHSPKPSCQSGLSPKLVAASLNGGPLPLMVQFPCDVTIECTDLEDLENTGTVKKAGGCGVVGVAYSDKKFFVSDACYKILRTWVVKTWCSWEQDKMDDYLITNIDLQLNTITFSTAIDSLILSRNIGIGEIVTLRYVTSGTTEIPGMREGDIYSMTRVGVRTFHVDFNTTKQELVSITGEGLGPHIFRYANSDLGLPVTCETLQATHPFGGWDTGCCDAGLGQHAWQDDGDGHFVYTQEIKVIDKVAPAWVSCDDLTFCNDQTDCSPVFINLTGEAIDVCTPQAQLQYSYQIDAFNDGTIDHTGTGNDASGAYPLGTHKITFKVTDQCGNWNTCTKLFTIVDCQKPTPICIDGLSVDLMPVPGGGMAVIWAASMEAGDSHDNCTDYDDLIILIERYSAITPGQEEPSAGASDVLQVTCDDRPPTTPNGIVEVVVWVGDAAGNWDYCVATVWVQDNMGICPLEGNTTVISSVFAPDQEAMNQVVFEISGDTTGVFKSQIDGNAYLTNLPLGAAVSIRPTKEDDPLNGVSTLDLQLMLKHITGVQSFKSPYEWMAADVDYNGIINLNDVLLLRRLILNPAQVPVGFSSWRFIDAGYVFPGMIYDHNYPDTKTFSGLTHGLATAFMGVKIGDVSGDAVPNEENEGKATDWDGTLSFEIADMYLQNGETHTLEIRTSEFEGIQGYQYSLDFDVDMMEFVHVDAQWTDLSAANFGLDRISDGVITTSWNSLKPVSLADGEVLYTVTFRAKSDLKLSEVMTVNSKVTRAEAYDANEELLEVNFRFDGNLVAGGTFELYQNEPNPFRDVTSIGFNLPESGSAVLTVYDITGAVIKEVRGDYAKGYNTVHLNRSEIQGNGMLYYSLETATHRATRMMLGLGR